MKKILSIILVATMLLFTVIPFAASAANGPTVSVSSATVCPGQIVQINVSISGNTGFSALKVDLAIPQGFTVMSIDVGTNFSNLQFTPNSVAGLATFATTTTATSDGVLCTFVLQADAFTSGTYTFGFDACEFYGYDLNLVAITTTTGAVVASHQIGTETCKDQICAACGTTVLGTGHVFGDYVYNNNATCTEDGTETNYCVTCGISGDTRTAVGSHNFIGSHVLLGYSHSCISCGAVITVCEDKDNNHICDVCSTIMSVCADTNGDDYCDVCGKDLSGEHKHVLKHTAAKAATCFEEGNIEYWYCAGCDCFFTDAEGKYNIAYLSCIIPVSHDIVHVEAKAPTATEEGNIEYWYCTKCGYAWLDELCTKNTNLKAVILPATGEHVHELVHTEAKEATCFEEGNLEYWYCAGCDCYFTDAEGKYNVARLSLITPVSHDIVHVEAKAPTATEEGNIEYWYCTKCGYAWLDEYCTLNTNLKAVILPATGEHVHNLEYTAAKEATCFEEGNLEYWYCAGCDCFFTDAEGKYNIAFLSLVTPVSHDIVHVEAKEPTATENGNIEYWYCTKCGYAWLDEYCTLNTNLKAVILPATGEINPPTGDTAVYFIVVLVAVAAVSVAVISYKKREEN